MKISHLSHNQINRAKYDQCILNAENSLIYANSWYLDVVSPGWGILVLDDYEAVFPLPLKRKFGIPYIAHPIYAQQLGLFTSKESDIEVDDFINLIPKLYRRLLLRLNYKHVPVISKFNERLNFILPLSTAEEVQKSVNKNTRRNIKKFENLEQKISSEVRISDFIALKKTTSKAMLSEKEWERMEVLISAIIERNFGFFRAVYDAETIVSAVLFTHWKDRICYLFSASSSVGMEKRASFGIVDDVIKEFSGKNFTLDFEGSMDENISRFFKGFGANPEIYYEIKRSI
jgi:hypothetical protein